MSVHPTVVSRVAALFAGLVLAAPAMAGSCDSPAHRSFDFWLGDWEVSTPNGKLVGRNRIDREYAGCVIHEHYTTARGYSGESLNVYDASRKLWHQTWVDTEGTLLVLEGGFRDGKMVLEGQTANADDPPTKHRITWSPGTDGGVRQLWESTDAKGQWTVTFDGRYTHR